MPTVENNGGFIFNQTSSIMNSSPVHENEGELVLHANRLAYDWCMGSTVHLFFKEMKVS